MPRTARTGPPLLAAALLAALLAALHPHPDPAAAQDRCEHRAERRARVEASASDRLLVRAGSGSLRVRGVRGLDEVRVRGIACASSRARLDALGVSASRRGDEVAVETSYPDGDDDRGWRGRYARLDLVVEVPIDPEAGAWMAADVRDTSGGMELSGLGATRVDDGSGGIRARRINGPLRIDDDSGEIHLADVGGDVEIDDGSGEIRVRDVDGSVTLEDGSGEIVVEEVDGDVVVRDDGSGEIRVRAVTGDFRVLDDGSGGIRHADVEGRVEIPRR